MGIERTTASSDGPAPVRPSPDKLTTFFWEGANQGRLMIQRCDDCGTYIHWPRPVCKRCLSFSLTPTQVSGRGSVYTYTVAVQAFHPWFESRVPYLLAVIELEEQTNLKLVSHLVECDEQDAAIGMPVEVVFERVDDELTLPMFRPRRAETARASGGVR